MRIVHLIPSLGSGGAERNLARIVNADRENEHVIIVIKKLENNIFYSLSNEATLISLEFSNYLSLPKTIRSYCKNLRRLNPDIVQTWMYHSNLFGGGLAILCGFKKIIWNIRSGEASFSRMKFATYLILLTGGIFSKLIPQKIVTPSLRSIDVHKKFFYSPSLFCHIPNGIESLNKKNKIKNKIPKVGFVARLDPQKNHDNFLKSLHLISYRAHFILIGKNVSSLGKSKFDSKNITLEFFDEHKYISSFYQEFDFILLPSIYGESFPNVILEGMSFGLVPIVSDVGDSFSIVGDCGYKINNPSSIQSIADGINHALEDYFFNQNKYQSKSKCARNIIKENFTLEKTIDKYHHLWNQVQNH